MLDTDIRITRARSILIREHPFLGCLAMRLIVRERSDIDTLAADGTFLYYCRAFLDKIPEPELVFCIAHEVFHCALSHMTRRGSRPWPLWQAATDYVVNLMLKDAGFKVPAWVKYFDEKYRGLNVEEVCQLLQQEEEQQDQEEQQGGQGSLDHMPNQNDDDQIDDEGAPSWDTGDEEGDADDQGNAEPEGQASESRSNQSGSDPGVGAGDQASSGTGDGSSDDAAGTSPGTANRPATAGGGPVTPSFGDPGGCGEVLDAAPPHDQAKLDDVASEWQVYTRQAANVARRAGEGKLPGFIEELVQELDTPRTDWREELRNFVDPQSNTKDYSWAKPNRRMMGLGLYVPGLISDGINHVAIIVDTSGSIDYQWLQKFGAETQAVLDDGAVDKITVIFADEAVHKTTEYAPGEQIDFTVLGRGGTKFSPAIAWVDEHIPDVSAAVYLTDLDCTDYGPPTTYPMLWAAYDSNPHALKARMERVPFGHCVQLQN